MAGTNVPSARAVVIGRDAEVAALADTILVAPGRLVTVTGCGGAGKTTVATTAARQVATEFEDGVWFVDLVGVTTPDAAVRALALALGIRESADRDLTSALHGFLGDRQVLVVLDNCEHLVDPLAALVDALLDVASGLRILATSREPLRITGEQVHVLSPLPVPTTRSAPVAELREISSVALFLDRARAVSPGIGLTDHNAAAIAEICWRLDGIPLALELAAVKTASMTVETMAERLADGFDLLIAKGRSRPERQQTMRAVIEWSHDLLSPHEQVVLRRLGVFPASWTIAAAEEVCAEDGVEVMLVLGDLVDKSLVVLITDAGEARYRLLAPVREYAAGKLAASGEHELVRDRHRGFFVGLAEQAEPAIHGPDQVAWIHRLDDDLDNLRLAVRSGHAREDAEGVLRLCSGVWWWAWQRGHMAEAAAWVDPALAQDVPSGVRVGGLRAAAMWHGSLGHHEQATALAAEMLVLANQADDLRQVARAETLLGMEHLRQGDLDAARPRLEEALSAASAANDTTMTANALVNLGHVAAQERGPRRAEELFREGLLAFEAAGDRWGVAYASNYLATPLRASGDNAGAAALSARAVGLLDELGDRFYLIFALEDLGRALVGDDRAETAARLFGAAHAVRRATGALQSPGARAEYDAVTADLERRLGTPVFSRAWVDGAGRSLTSLLEEATAAEPASERGAFAGPNGALTRREVEVARLLADGLSNKEIAARLVIATGTAGIHVERILRKLGLRSRHQVADWGRSNGLVDDGSNTGK